MMGSDAEDARDIIHLSKWMFLFFQTSKDGILHVILNIGHVSTT